MLAGTELEVGTGAIGAGAGTIGFIGSEGSRFEGAMGMDTRAGGEVIGTAG